MAGVVQVFLDALGEPLDSVRRFGNRGLYDWQVLNGGTPYAVDLVLLDERYEREPLPCHTRARMCTAGNSSLSVNRQVRLTARSPVTTQPSNGARSSKPMTKSQAATEAMIPTSETRTAQKIRARRDGRRAASVATAR